MSTFAPVGASESGDASFPFPLPPLGGNPASGSVGTTPASFAAPARIAPGIRGRYTFSSPDTPGMPTPSTKTAWDFMPADWVNCGLVAKTNYEPAAAWQSAGRLLLR